MRISDWSSNVCSSDLVDRTAEAPDLEPRRILAGIDAAADDGAVDDQPEIGARPGDGADGDIAVGGADPHRGRFAQRAHDRRAFIGILDAVVVLRSEEHPSELQSLMRLSYAVFC